MRHYAKLLLVIALAVLCAACVPAAAPATEAEPDAPAAQPAAETKAEPAAEQVLRYGMIQEMNTFDPAREGAIGPEHIQAELGEVLTGRHPGRQTEGEITVFDSLGLAVEDLVAAQHLYRRAKETGTGTRVAFG